MRRNGLYSIADQRVGRDRCLATFALSPVDPVPGVAVADAHAAE